VKPVPTTRVLFSTGPDAVDDDTVVDPFGAFHAGGGQPTAVSSSLQ